MSAVAATTAASVTATLGATIDTGSALVSLITTVLPSMVTSALPAELTTTQPVTSTVIAVPPMLEITATFAGALAGALTGVRMRFDLIGIVTLAVVAGLGGGIIRDVLLQDYGIYALDNPQLLLAALAAAAIGFFFFTLADKLKWALFLVDAVALGLFAAIGTDKALLAGLATVSAVLLGTITAVGGGMLRDVLTDDVPQVLQPGAFYATAAVAGSLLYIAVAGWLNVVKPVAVVICVLAVLLIRLITHRFGWQTPVATDLTPVVVAAPRHLSDTGGRAYRRLRGIREPERHDAPTEDETG